MTGHEGTSPFELLIIVLATTPVGLMFYQAATLRLSRTWELILWEAISFVIPMILCQSNLLYPWGVAYMMVQLAVGVDVYCQQQRHLVVQPKPSQAASGTRPHAALTIYRASLIFLTCIAILAVDFRIFPRRFAKTETHGYSLMDMGAASFVFAAGLVSDRSRGREKDWKRTCLRVIPLVAMGLVRLLTHKGLDYQEHVSEYGVHWNFFFTLAMLSPTALIVPGPGWVLPSIVLIVYQMVLSSGLQQWIVEAPRKCQTSVLPFEICTLIVANREGILGCIGYGTLYLLSEWVGQQVLWRQRKLGNVISSLLVGLVLVIAIFTTVLDTPVSRRSTNAPFVCWILFINLLQLAAIDYVAIGKSCRIPLVFEAVNRHGLTMFIVANLLTGTINLSFNTLETSDVWAFLILFAYISIIGGIAYSLDHFIDKQAAKAKPE